MVRKPLYHGAIDIHGAAPSPDNSIIATTGRGTSNVYLIDVADLRVVGNVPNAQASDSTNKEHITSGLLVGREPHEPTFTRNGAELWVTVRGEGRIAILDVATAKAGGPTERALRGYLDTINGPAQAWFSKDGKVAFVASQKSSQIDVFETNFGSDGHSRPKRTKTVEIRAQDPRAFTPFLKTSPDGQEVWFSHKLADAVSAWSANAELQPMDTVGLGEPYCGDRPIGAGWQPQSGRPIFLDGSRSARAVDESGGHASLYRARAGRTAEHTECWPNCLHCI
jgi:hypothetical protein